MTNRKTVVTTVENHHDFFFLSNVHAEHCAEFIASRPSQNDVKQFSQPMTLRDFGAVVVLLLFRGHAICPSRSTASSANVPASVSGRKDLN